MYLSKRLFWYSSCCRSFLGDKKFFIEIVSLGKNDAHGLEYLKRFKLLSTDLKKISIKFGFNTSVTCDIL